MWVRVNEKLQQMQINANSMDIFELDLGIENEAEENESQGHSGVKGQSGTNHNTATSDA